MLYSLTKKQKPTIWRDGEEIKERTKQKIKAYNIWQSEEEIGEGAKQERPTRRDRMGKKEKREKGQ